MDTHGRLFELQDVPFRPSLALFRSVFSTERRPSARNSSFEFRADKSVTRSVLKTERNRARLALHGTSAAQTSVHACPLTPYFECLQPEHGDL